MKQPEVTCILTSCGRFDLLRRTLDSFLKFNTYDIKEFIVFNDGSAIPHSFVYDYPMIKFSCCIPRAGQINALDVLWKQVETPYAFTMEDDWEFLRPGFIEDSLQVLESRPDVLQCWLWPPQDSVQPVDWVTEGYGVLKTSGGLWSGTGFNPALKRKADYDLIAPYSQHTEWNPARPWKSEADISKVYHKLGFKGAVLSGAPYITHIGINQHVGP